MADNTVEESGPAGATARTPGKRRVAKRKAAKRAPRKKVVGKASPKKAVGKKKVAKKGFAKKTTGKVRAPRKKTTSASAMPTADVEAGPRRRGRPVSVDALKRKLDIAREAVRRERNKRRDMSAATKRKIAEHVARNKALRSELAEVRRVLSDVEAKEKAAEKERSATEAMDRAREAAVAKFTERWEQDYLKRIGKRKAKRGRPGRKRRAKKSAT
jgi:hypothetical protein